MTLLSLEDVSMHYGNGKLMLKNVNLTVQSGEVVGIIGQSGCGKTTLVRCILQILPNAAVLTSGVILYQGEDVLQMKKHRLRQLRGHQIAFIPQNVDTAFNDVLKIKKHFYDVMGYRNDKEILQLLDIVHLSDPHCILNCYPFELSGGMKQRVLFALALSLKPMMLIADEPTSSVDAVIRKQVMQEMMQIKQYGNMALIIISHNIRELFPVCKRISVMYEGKIIETAPPADLLANPHEEYTATLLRSVKFNG